MASSEILFPEGVDVILPIMDGWTPIVPADLNVYSAVIRRLEEVLGHGPNEQTPATYGPAAANTTLAARLDALLETDGAPKDVALVTGTAQLGEFEQNGTGKFIGFGKALSRAGDGPDSYQVLFDFKIPGSVEENGIEKWDPKVPSCWWVNQKVFDGCWIAARNMKGQKIEPSDATTVQYCLLAVGYEAFTVHT